ncbi:ATP-dependent helicase [Candidatus Uhrbacteria bacterium]|nr:ATP-dependent helicase [Candidatus Uhrbacteria bacterium]
MSMFILSDDSSSDSPSTSGRVHTRIDYSKALNQEQLDVVLHGDGPCLVLAGAGSGKTRTLVYRVAYLLEQGVDPSQILLLTFTNKAAREMLSRVSGLIGTEAKGIWGGTFHSIGSRILRRFATDLGYTSQFTIFDSDDSRDLIKAVMKDLSIDPKARRFPSASVVQDVISYARNVQMRVDEVLEDRYPNFFAFSGDIEEIARQYQQRKKSANAMDFDDLLANLALLLDHSSPHCSLLITHYRYILVDEYQDTNTIQARIVHGFARVHQNVLVVGDDAQSIYAFRGADIKNILGFPEQWPNTKIFRLLTNYRSVPEILDLANESLSHNVNQFEKELVGMHAHGEKPKLIPCASTSQEAHYIAEQILVLRAQGLALHNIAVLFRSSAHSQALEFELMKRDIPYEYRGGQKFFERAHIKDVMAFLRVANNPQDEVAWMRVLGLQSGIGASTASMLATQAKTFTALPEILAVDVDTFVPSRGRAGWQDFHKLATNMLAQGPGPAEMIRAVCKSHYQDYLQREYPNWRERLEDLEQLALFAEGYDEITAFLTDMALYDDVVAKREETGERVDQERMVLSTIHQAKGLEWNTVFVIHLADNAFPNRRALSEEGGMEEERRLFYVAITRAQHRLFLTYPMTMGYDTLMFNQPSTFIDEVSPRLFERIELRESWKNQDPRTRNQAEDEGWEEPSIQLEDQTPRRTSFLRDIDEL